MLEGRRPPQAPTTSRARPGCDSTPRLGTGAALTAAAPRAYSSLTDSPTRLKLSAVDRSISPRNPSVD
jgi:hypothetical protein